VNEYSLKFFFRLIFKDIEGMSSISGKKLRNKEIAVFLDIII
jgi:hypothetical protein